MPYPSHWLDFAVCTGTSWGDIPIAAGKSGRCTCVMSFRRGISGVNRLRGEPVLTSLISRPIQRQLIYIVIATAFFLTGSGIDQLHAEDTGSDPEIKPINKVLQTKNDVIPQVSINSCNSCHSISSEFSHPIGVAPSMDIPSYFLLNGKGNLTCQTCHENTSAQDHIIADSTKTGILRSGKSGRSFCMECHQSTSDNPLNMHALVLTKAHPQQHTSLEGISSKTCLTCHDGSVATDAGYGMGMPDDPLRRARGILTAHPVDIEYRPRISRESGNLRSEFNLDKRIRLTNSKVTCGSCHSLYSTENKLLVMSNKKSSLCLSCHKY